MISWMRADAMKVINYGNKSRGELYLSKPFAESASSEFLGIKVDVVVKEFMDNNVPAAVVLPEF
jgi:hypothetical protein